MTHTATTDLAFLSAQQIREVMSLAASQLDVLPFGTIQLDAEGTILGYNRTEALLTGRDPSRVIGRNFFTDVAPCTNVKEFAGRFREGVTRGELHVSFPYRFDFQMAPRDVTVTLFYSQTTRTAWVFVKDVTRA
jgi:photoactive yellow protein